MAQNRLKLSRWTTIRVKGRNAPYEPKNALKRHPLTFYSITHTQKTAICQIFAFTHAHTHKEKTPKLFGCNFFIFFKKFRKEEMHHTLSPFIRGVVVCVFTVLFGTPKRMVEIFLTNEHITTIL